MSKNQRELVVLGKVNIEGRGLTKIVAFPPPSDEQLERLDGSKFGSYGDGFEAAAAQAMADAEAALEREAELRARDLYAGTGADPGSIVGLDGFTPMTETAGDGDPNRTDPDASRSRAGKRPAR